MTIGYIEYYHLQLLLIFIFIGIVTNLKSKSILKKFDFILYKRNNNKYANACVIENSIISTFYLPASDSLIFLLIQRR